MQASCRIVIRTAAIVAAILLTGLPRANAQADGEQVFQRSCRTCHTGTSESRAPGPDALASVAPRAIIDSLVNGAMRVQGARLSGAERRAVAEYLTGTAVTGDVTGAAAGRCAVAPSADVTPAAGAWNGWGASVTNARFQSSGPAGITLEDLPRLRLQWAFGFPDASSAWAQPAVVAGRVFVGSQNGTVYALDAKSGCIHWTYAAAGGVRTAVSVGPADAATGQSMAYFGDTGATVYALDAATGRERWTRRIDVHPLARITGSPTFHDGRLYVPLSSYEEAQGADPQYGCCTFRGSITALDAASGAVVWKTHLIPEEPKPRGTSTAGVTLWGPSGSAVWSAPTVDVRRRVLYVATGNTYSGPAHPSSDAVVALDLETGAVRWMRQVTSGDVYLTGCRSGADNPNCPGRSGPDHDFGSSPILATLGGARDILVIGQKSGLGFAMNPDKHGEVIWQYQAGRGGPLGGIEWGAAADGEFAYFAVSDTTRPRPGGLHAVKLEDGARAWFAAPPPPACGSGRGCSAAQSAAVSAIPGAVFSGSNDGVLRAYASRDGSVIWAFDTNREFASVNGVPARGASMQGPGPAIAGGMMFVNSGYGAFGGRAGNVLLAFGVD
jgi:polyvinyl alcohol dehydrogenase (cytochrome)